MIANRRSILAALSGFASLMCGRAQAAPDARHAAFVAQAFAMKQRAIDSGDQAFGAVVVRGGEIAGYGPSRVLLRKDSTAHAEREALRDAQARLGRTELSDCVIYSTSRPCADCQQALAAAKVSRMYVGEAAADAGAPRGTP